MELRIYVYKRVIIVNGSRPSAAVKNTHNNCEAPVYTVDNICK